jgi:hypothetical protein
VKLLVIAPALFLLIGCAQNGPGDEPALGEEPKGELPGEEPEEPGAEEPAPPEPPPVTLPTTYVAGIDHSYMPLVPGTVWSYAGHEEGTPKREEVTVPTGRT